MVDIEQQKGELVLILRSEGNALMRGVVVGMDDRRGKVIVRGLPPIGGEFLVPTTLLQIGVAESRSGHLKFFRFPLSGAVKLMLGDNQ